MWRKYQKLILFGIALAVCIFLVIRLTIFFAPPIPEPLKDTTAAKIDTADWQTCRNEKAGYEFRYPKDWFVYGEGAQSTGDFSLIATTTCTGFYVWVLDQPPPISEFPTVGVNIADESEEYVHSLHNVPGGPGVTNESILKAYARTTAGARSGSWVTIDHSRFLAYPARGSTEYSTILAGRLYSIFPFPELDPQLFKAILSTFKFLR